MKERLFTIGTLLCTVLLIVTVGKTTAKYVSSIPTNFTLNAKASEYSLIYDANGGSFGDGEAQKAEKKTADNDFTIDSSFVPTRPFFTFDGWLLGETVYKAGAPLATNALSTTLKANWIFNENTQASQAIKVNVDGNNVTMTQIGVDSCEKSYFPLTGLKVGAKYRISFDFYYQPATNTPVTFYNNGTDGHSFGYAITKEGETIGHQGSTAKVEKTPIKQFHNATTSTHYSHEFTATDTEMSLALITCDIQDKIEVNMYLNNLSVERIMPTPVLNATTVGTWDTGGTYATAPGEYKNIEYAAEGDGVSFTLTGTSSIERVAIPLQDLVPNTNYTLSFKFKGNPKLISDSDGDSTGNTYYYGYCIAKDTSGISSDANYRWYSFGRHVTYPGVDEVDFENTYSISFRTAAAASSAYEHLAYLILNFGDVQDNVAYNFALTELRIEEGVGNGPVLLSLPVNEVNEEESIEPEREPIELNYDGIVDEGLIWKPMNDEDPYPYADEDYTMLFRPEDGYELHLIRVIIDGQNYVVLTDGDNEEGEPDFDPEKGILTIPAALLTAETQAVTISAEAVPVQEETEEVTETVPAPAPETEEVPEEPKTEEDTPPEVLPELPSETVPKEGTETGPDTTSPSQQEAMVETPSESEETEKETEEVPAEPEEDSTLL